MSKFSFTGDLEPIRPRQLEFISEVLEKRGFTGPEAKIENLGLPGENYMSTVKKITVTENGETFKMIAKLASDNDSMRAMSNTAKIFKNEELVYAKLLPKFVQIQKKAGADAYRYPEFYGALDEEKNEIILLEDLKESQFSIHERLKDLNDDCVKKVLKNLAVYHSMSYVLKNQEPDYFNELKSNFFDIYNNSGMDNTYYRLLEEFTVSIVSEEYKKYIKDSFLDFTKIYKKVTEGDIGSKHSVIQHGDCWTNNIMFRIMDGVPEECILIDYQLAKESNPAFDLMYLMFSCTSHEQRLRSYYDYLDVYHRELDNSLQKHGLEARKVYPREQLDLDLKRFVKFMFPLSIFVTTVLVRNPEEAEVLKRLMETDASSEESVIVFDMSPESAVLFRKRVEGLVDSCREFGLWEK